MDPQDFDERNELLRTLAQVAGGSLLAIGAYWTAQNVIVNREGNINDRYIRAIALLNASDELGCKHLETRIGAILVLEQIAADSPSHQRAVMESLAAYVRSNSRVDSAKVELWNSWDELPEDYEEQIRDELKDYSCPSDIQQAMSVIARRGREQDRNEPLELNFEGADLRKIEITGAFFPKCNFNSCDFSGAKLWDVSLAQTQFWASNLSRTYIMRGGMQKAFMPRAIVVGSTIGAIDMKEIFAENTFWDGSSLYSLTLDAANLGDSHLERASFSGGSFERTNFHGDGKCCE